MIFTSGLPRSVDPQPYVYPDGYRTVSPDDGWKGTPRYEPRTAEVNPILARMRHNGTTAKDVLAAFAPGFDQFAYPYTAAQIEHAVKVAQKLSAL